MVEAYRRIGGRVQGRRKGGDLFNVSLINDGFAFQRPTRTQLLIRDINICGGITCGIVLGRRPICSSFHMLCALASVIRDTVVYVLER